MNFSIILISLGLSINSFSISITGELTDNPTILEALEIDLFFGSFQAVIPIIRWFAGETLIGYISDFDHWIVFSLLIIIGSRMIYESKNAKSKGFISISSIGVLLMMSVVTSIDA